MTGSSECRWSVRGKRGPSNYPSHEDCFMMAQGVFHLIAQGGITMVMLAIFSIFSLAVTGERIYTYYKAQRVTQQVAEKAMQYVADGKMTEALRLCEQNTVSPVARVLEAGLVAVIDQRNPVQSVERFSRRLESCKRAMQGNNPPEIPPLGRHPGPP